MPASHSSRCGLLYALAAYACWGGFPLFFSLLSHVSPWTVMSHRVVWSLVFLTGILLVQRRLRAVFAALRSPRTVGWLALGALAIGTNWLVFILAVSSGHVLQSSLGYFINPLISVLLGAVVLGERLRPGQWLAVGLAATGVAVLASGTGAFPWMALTIAVSFGSYGLVRKKVPVGPMVGLLIETLVLLPLSLALLGAAAEPWGPAGSGAGVPTPALLMAAGVVTAVPLLWFAAAAQRLKLSVLGFLQYSVPTLQFLTALLILREPVGGRQWLCFALIWCGLFVFSLEMIRHRRRPRVEAAFEPGPLTGSTGRLR